MGVEAPGFKGDRPGVKDADWTLVWRVRAAVAAAEVTLGEKSSTWSWWVCWEY